MPITNPFERIRVRQLGYDPDEFESVDVQEDTPNIEVEEPKSTPPQNPTSKVSPARSFVQSAARQFPSAAIGLAAGAKAAAMTAPMAGIPIVGPFIPPAAGIVTGLGAGILSKMGQDAAIENILPESISTKYKEAEQQDLLQNPKSTIAGGLAATLPFMRPSVGVLKNAGQVLTKMPRGIAPTANEVNALANVGLGAGVGAGIPIGTKLYKGEEIDPIETLIETVGGALLHQPTKLGTKLGIPKINTKEFPSREGIQEAQQGDIDPVTIETRASEPTVKNPEDIQYEAEYNAQPYVQEIQTKAKEAMAKAEALEQLKAIKRADFEATKQIEAELNVEKLDAQRANELQQRETIAKEKEVRKEDFIKGKVETLKEEPPQPLKTIQEERGTKPVETELDKEVYPDYTGNLEIDAELNRTTPKTEAELIQEQYDKMLQEGTQDFQNNEALKNQPSKRLAEYFKELGVLRNVKVDDSGIITDSTGKEISGESFARMGIDEALAKVNPNKATTDTYPHELTHPFLDDLLTYGTPAQQKLVNRGLNIIADSPAFAEWKSSLSLESSYNKLPVESQAKEFLTQKSGEDVIRRLLKTDGKGAIKNWLSDFWSNVKQKFDKATPEDYTRLISDKLLNERPFKEGFAQSDTAKVVGALTSKNPVSQEAPPVMEDVSKQESSAPNTIPIKSGGSEGFNLKFARPEIDKVAALGSPEAKQLADGMTKFFDDFNNLRGRFVNSFTRKTKNITELDNPVKNIFEHPLQYLQQNTPEMKNVLKWFWDTQDGIVPAKLTAKEEQLKNEVTRVMQDVRDQHRTRGDLAKHLGEENNPNYLPNTVDSSVVKTILENPKSPEAKKLFNDFKQYQIKKGRAKTDVEAQKVLDTFMEGYHKKDLNIAEQFGPIDKSAGIGIPRSWRDKNLLNGVTRYLDRVSRRFAYYDNFESKPEILKALQDHSGNESVASINRVIAGVRPHGDNPLLSGLSGAVRSTQLGPLTGARDITSGLTLGFQHHENPLQATKNAMKAFTNLKENIAGGYKTGRIRFHLSALETEAGVDDFVSVLRRFRDVASDASGRNYLDQIIRAINFGQGKWTTLDFIQQAQKGNLSAAGKKWFQDFADGIDPSKVSPEDMDRIAARYVDSVQGTYDPRGLPRGAYEGQLSWLLALNRWGIEKSNNFVKHTVNPLLKGNPRPALNATIGMLIGGAAVQSLTELVTQRKQKTPTTKELIAEPSAGGVMYKLAGLASAAGHVGMLGDLIKSLIDVAYGKNRPQEINDLLVDTASNISATVTALGEEWLENGLSVDSLLAAGNQILEDNMQAYRLILAHLSEDKGETIEKGNKLRDLRTYKTLKGEDIADLSTSFKRPLGDKDKRDFKKTDSLEEAEALLPDLIKKAIDKSGGSVELLKKEFDKLKINSYQTMPNPENFPESFASYYQFLVETQGVDEANKRVEDYAKQNLVNREKSRMVP